MRSPTFTASQSATATPFHHYIVLNRTRNHEMRYRRAVADGAMWFFTVNLAERQRDLLVRHVDVLRHAVRKVKANHPFEIVAMVVLPDHLHAIWSLPAGDHDYSLRWNLIKGLFSKALPQDEWIRASRVRKRERGIWQRRFWEHQIRDEFDLQKHVDYIHINAVKHGYVTQAIDWPYSSLHRYVRRGDLPANWASGEPMKSRLE